MAPDATERFLAFDSWIAGRSGALTRFAYVLTGSEVAAEQALASALTVASVTWKRVRRSDDPEAYVLRLVVQAHLAGRGRSPRRASLVVPAAAEAESIGAPADDADTDADADAERAWQVCSTLPPTERAAIVLRCYAEQTYPQIAATLDTKEAAVRDIVGRCFAALSRSIRAGRAFHQLEAAFREAFLRHAEDPGDALDLASLVRAGAGTGRRRRRLAVAAAGAVLLAGTATVASTFEHGGPGTAADRQPGAHPRGWRAESYNGIQLWVPSSWGWGEVPRRTGLGLVTCGAGAYSPTAVNVNLRYRQTDGGYPPFVGRPVAPGTPCPPAALPTAAHVWFDSPLEVGAARGAARGATTVRVNGVTSFNITVADADQVERRVILRSIQPVTIDAHGCPRDSAGIRTVEALSQPEPPPVSVRTMSVCLYAASPAAHQVLYYSTRIEGLTAQRATASLQDAATRGAIDVCLVTPAQNQVIVIARTAVAPSVYGVNPGRCPKERVGFLTGAGFHVLTERSLRLWATDGLSLYANPATRGNRLSPYLPLR